MPKNEFKIPENLLHQIWQCGAFSTEQLRGKAGELIQPLKLGRINDADGPDIEGCVIQIDGIIWHGPVEIHLDELDWYRHKHHLDPKYDNVILHVIWQSGHTSARNTFGSEIPSLDLSKYVSEQTLSRYRSLITSLSKIPCASFLPELRGIEIKTYLERLVWVRMQERSEVLQSKLISLENDWRALCWHQLCSWIGRSQNKKAFQMLADQLNFQVLLKVRKHRLQIEALVFGTAGLIQQVRDDAHRNDLEREWKYLRQLHGFEQIQLHYWKRRRTNPFNFPLRRLQFFVHLLCQPIQMPELIFSDEDFDRILQFLRETSLPGKGIGEDYQLSLLINVVAPLRFLYAQSKDAVWMERSVIESLSKIPAENNNIQRLWKQHGLLALDASESQALHYLYTRMCSQKQCLNCRLGTQILRSQ